MVVCFFLFSILGIEPSREDHSLRKAPIKPEEIATPINEQIAI
jgi:hypothetical protein